MASLCSAMFRQPLSHTDLHRETLSAAIIDNLPGGVYRTDASSNALLFLSHGARELIDGQLDELLADQSDFDVLIHPDDLCRWRGELSHALTEGQRHEVLYRLKPGIGRHHPQTWVLDRGVVINERGRLFREGLLLDMTSHQRVQQHLAYVVDHDAVTGLWQRLPFINHLERFAERGEGALFYLDIVRYSSINNELGHQAGDELLHQVAQRLSQCVSESSVLARMGADEFAVFVPDAERQHEIMARLLTVLKPAYQIAGQLLAIDISIGLAQASTCSADVLIRQARLALQYARINNQTSGEFEADLSQMETCRLPMEQALRDALARNEMEVYYQVQVDAYSGQMVGAESLMRWRHPELGNVPPDSFIPLAEEMGLINALGRWSLECVCQQLVDWDRVGFHMPRVSVNVSALQLTPALIHEVERLLNKHGLAPSRLELEVTETQLIRDLALSHTILQTLRERGIAIALDDFGTGYSSLAYLASLPLDRLKIDKRFVDGVPDRLQERGVITAIISMALALELDVIVEGVESRRQWHYLRDHQCGTLQGYLFGVAMPADEFMACRQALAEQR